ncbi:MAG: efflux RND transporter permease subunit [Pseudomonadota bacterium]
MIAWFARNSVAANLLMFVIFIGGFVALQNNIKLEVFPPAEPDTIRVEVALRGATPEDVELGVAVRVEEAIQDLEGIERISSTSIEGGTSVALEVAKGYDPREVLDDVKSRVDAINTLPIDAERPVVLLASRRFDVIDVVVSGAFDADEVRLYAEQVRDELLREPDVTQVQLDEAARYEVAIEASQDRLREFDVTLADLARAVRNSSVDLSAGNVRTLGGDVLIRSKGQAYERTDFDNIVVKTNADGSIVRVSDIATVIDAFEETSVITRYNGRNAVLIGVSRVGDQSALAIAERVRNYIERKQSTLPVGMALTYWDDDSQILRKRLGILSQSALQGGLLVIGLLALFLRPAIAFWVFLGIPISFFGAFLTMSLFGISLNVMSAFGFIIVLGIVVDDAIVTGENVYRHLQRGDDGEEAAIVGTQEIAAPVTFGVLTTVAAFLPLMFIDGWFGRIFGPIPMVVIPVLLFSLIESKFILPAHLKHVRVRNRADDALPRWQRIQRSIANGFETAILRYYEPVLNFTLKYRYATLATFVGAFVLVATLISSGWMRFTLFPPIESETARATLTMPVGTPFEVTDRYVRRMADAVEVLREKYNRDDTIVIKDVYATSGAGGRTVGQNIGGVRFEIVPPEERTEPVRMRQLVSEWRELVGPLPGAESLSYRATIFNAGSPIDVQFSGNSLQTLSRVGEEFKAHLGNFAGVFEISDSLSDGKQELKINLTPEGHVLGLTRNDVVGQVGDAFKGLEVQRVQRGRDDVRVLVRLPADERQTLSALSDLLINAPDGSRVPLANVATLTAGKGPAQINRIDRYRVLNVTAEINKSEVNLPVLQSDLREYLDGLLTKYPSVSYSFEGEAREQAKSFGSLRVGLILVLFGIYCLLALPLKSYTQPLLVMCIIPFGAIGAVFGHWLMGKDLSMLSLLGLMALIGVVINDSLVLVDFINQQRRSGVPVGDAVRAAGVRRFRPVILTSMTTFLGLTPLLFDQSTTAQFLIPMAISLGFGILFATVITLVLVPVNCLIADDLSSRLRRTASPAGGVAAGGATGNA